MSIPVTVPTFSIGQVNFILCLIGNYYTFCLIDRAKLEYQTKLLINITSPRATGKSGDFNVFFFYIYIF